MSSGEAWIDVEERSKLGSKLGSELRLGLSERCRGQEAM